MAARLKPVRESARAGAAAAVAAAAAARPVATSVEEDEAAGFPPVELALDVFPQARLATVMLRREDKEVFDALQAWWHFRHGRRLTQWELFSLILAEALEDPAGRFGPARFVRARGAS